MKLTLKRSNLLKFGFASIALTLGVVSYAQMNAGHHSFSIIKVSNAKADVTCRTASSTCKFTSGDGVSHEVTNAENS